MDEIRESGIYRDGKLANGSSSDTNLSNNNFAEKNDTLLPFDFNLQEEKPTCYLKPKPPIVLDKRGERDNFWQKAIKFLFNGTCFLPDESSEDLKENFDYKITDNDKGYVTIKKKVGDKIEKTGFYAYYDSKYNVNGEIDTEVKQGQMEDCGLISLIYSVAQSEKGKQIIKNAISQNINDNNQQDGFNVHFKGLDETYTITQEEIDSALDKQLDYYMDKSKYFYAQGDKDMVLFELAWNKCCINNSQALNDIKNQNIYHFRNSEYPEGLSGTYQYQLFYALIGGNFNENPTYIDAEIKEVCETAKKQRKESIQKQLSESNEFKLSDFSITQEYIRCFNSANEIELELNSSDSYKIINENSEEDVVIVKNINTGKTYSVNKNELIDTMVGMSSAEETEKLFDIEYQRALDSDVVTLGTNSNCSFFDINGEKVQLVANHKYGIKSINENQVVLVNPWNTEEEIILSKEKLKKQFYSGNRAFASNFIFCFGNL